MDVVLKRGTANLKLSGGRKTPAHVRNSIWVMNPVGLYDTCPTTCAHLPKKVFDVAVEAGLPVSDNPSYGCYANSRVKLQALKGEQLPIDDAIDAIVEGIPSSGLVRWAEVGDVMGDSVNVLECLLALKHRRPDVTLIAYTHAWRVLGARGSAVFRASCETPLELALAESLGYRAALTVPQDWTPRDAQEFRAKQGSERVFVCPAPAKTSCVECRACDTSNQHVAFPAHGIRKNYTGNGIV